VYFILSFVCSSISYSSCFNVPSAPVFSTLSLHDALPIYRLPKTDVGSDRFQQRREAGYRRPQIHCRQRDGESGAQRETPRARLRSEEHTSELQSRFELVCRLLLEINKRNN